MNKKKVVGISCNLKVELYEALRKKCYEEYRTQRSIIEQALRDLFAHQRK